MEYLAWDFSINRGWFLQILLRDIIDSVRADHVVSINYLLISITFNFIHWNRILTYEGQRTDFLKARIGVHGVNCAHPRKCQLKTHALKGLSD